jgi:hypothetical protein
MMPRFAHRVKKFAKIQGVEMYGMHFPHGEGIAPVHRHSQETARSGNMILWRFFTKILKRNQGSHTFLYFVKDD